MERLSFANKKIMVIFAGLFVLGIVTCMIPVSVIKLHHIPAFAYVTMILIWAVSIRRRIVDAKIRRRILAACFFMVLLFFLRMCKFSYFPDDVYVNEYLWYGYTVPLTAIPGCMFMAALNVEPVGNKRLTGAIEKLLIILMIVIAAVVFTNGYHSFVYKITVHPDKEYTHEWFYWVILFYRIGLSIAILCVLLRKCSLSAAKKKWYIPVICIAISCILLTWYLINGGAPRIMGHKLFQLQEAVCIPFIIAFESIIQIGMIPANSGYRHLFDHSGISACIYDNRDNPVLVSGKRPEGPEDEDHRISRESISGGYITWVEDLSPVNTLNREIEEVTEELGDENDFIRKENEFRAERISVEERNRLYNRIAAAVRTRAVRTDALLSEALEGNIDEDELRGKIIYASVLGAYIKRMGNLMLLTDGAGSLSSGELCASIRESFEYLKVNGCRCFLDERSRCDINSQAVLLAYELFEDVVEDVWLRLHAISVSLGYEDDYEMVITLDAAAEAISSVWKDKEVSAAGCSLSVKYEDETYSVRFKFPDPGRAAAEKEAEV
ncbi:MAG: hypothetical protein K6G22_01935 [Lachnospiraceae bacterium]|nr:hypothetical protein [Lachnospiraceae bacterium]